MRRAFMISGGLLLLLVLATVAGVTIAHRLAPERLQARVEARLSRVAGAEVQIGELELAWAWPPPWIRVQIERMRAVRSDVGSAELGAVQIDLNPLFLIFGHVNIRRLEVLGERVVLHAAPGATSVEADVHGATQVDVNAPPEEMSAPQVGPDATKLDVDAPPTETNASGASPTDIPGAPPAQLDASGSPTAQQADAAEGAAPAGLGGRIQAAAALGELLRETPCPVQRLDFSEIDIWRETERGAELLIENLRGEFSCLTFGLRGGRLRTSGALALGEAQTQDFTLEVRARGGEASASLSADDIALGPLGALLKTPTDLSGALSLNAHWRAPRNGPQTVRLEFEGEQVRGTFGGGLKSAPHRIDLPAPSVRLLAHATPGRLTLDALEVQDGGIVLHAGGNLALPFTEAAPAEVELRTSDLSLAELRRLLAQLPAGVRRVGEVVLRRVEAGVLRRLLVRIESSADGLIDMAARGPLLRPGEITVEAGIEEAHYRSRAGNLVSEITGEVHYDGERIAFKDFGAELGGSRLGRLDLTLAGLPRLTKLGDLRCEATRRVTAMPGIAAFREWRESRRPPDAPTSQAEFQLDLEFLKHPMLLCSAREVVMTLRALPGGLPQFEGSDLTGTAFTVERAVWAGLPVELTGGFGYHESGERWVRLDARITAPPAPGASTRDRAFSAHEDFWGNGRFVYLAETLGGWKLENASGVIHARGTRLQLDDVTLRLLPGGVVSGGVTMDFGKEGDPEYAADMQFAGVPLLDLWHAAGLERGLLSGRLYGAVVIEGPLLNGRGVLEQANGAVSFSARSGEVHRKVPLMFAIALAGSRFNPFGERDRIAYDAIDIAGALNAGLLEVNNATLQSARLRVAGDGSTDFGDDGKLEAVVGLFFFPQLDRLINRIPVVNRVVLGDNENLVGAYFSVGGSLTRPSAELIPVKSLVQSPAGALFDLPGRVMGAIRSVQSMLLPGSRAREREREREQKPEQKQQQEPAP